MASRATQLQQQLNRQTNNRFTENGEWAVDLIQQKRERAFAKGTFFFVVAKNVPGHAFVYFTFSSSDVYGILFYEACIYFFVLNFVLCCSLFVEGLLLLQAYTGAAQEETWLYTGVSVYVCVPL